MQKAKTTPTSMAAGRRGVGSTGLGEGAPRKREQQRPRRSDCGLRAAGRSLRFYRGPHGFQHGVSRTNEEGLPRLGGSVG